MIVRIEEILQEEVEEGRVAGTPEGRRPARIHEALELLSRGSRGSPLFRCYQWLHRQRRHTTSLQVGRLGHLSASGGEENCDLLPSHFPCRPDALVGIGLPGVGRRRQQRARVRRIAWCLAEWQLAAFSFLTLDCPKHPSVL